MTLGTLTKLQILDVEARKLIAFQQGYRDAKASIAPRSHDSEFPERYRVGWLAGDKFKRNMERRRIE